MGIDVPVRSSLRQAPPALPALPAMDDAAAPA